MHIGLLSARPLVFAILVGCFFLMFSLSKTAVAQIMPYGESSTIYITADPAYPEPNAPVTLSLDDYGTNTLGATISWYVDGVEVVESRNDRSLSIMSGSVGDERVVRVTLSGGTVSNMSATYTIRPMHIDIILEADTYVPSFYNGRALPSSEASVRAIALVHDGKNARSSYSYKWTFGDAVLFGGPVKGKYAVDVTMPRLSGARLTVEVYNESGTIIGRKSMNVGAANPQLVLYEYSPLKGLAKRALGTTVSMLGEEMTLYAEPYFLNTRALTQTDVTFTWNLDGAVVDNNQSDQNAITLTRVGDARESRIDVSALTTKRPPQYLQESLTLMLE